MLCMVEDDGFLLLDGMASIDIKQAPTLTVKNTQCVDTHLAIK